MRLSSNSSNYDYKLGIKGQRRRFQANFPECLDLFKRNFVLIS